MPPSRPRTVPERRTRTDLLISALIVVVVLVAGVVIWWFSPVRHTTLDQSGRLVPAAGTARTVPAALVPLWQAPSSATRVPALSRALVITGDDGAVVARDPATGKQVWRYYRNRRVCSVLAAWRDSHDTVLAVYGNSRGCSEVTALQGETGARTGARTSDADKSVELAGGSNYVLAQGRTRLETWGSNLVRGIEYGRIEAPVKPDAQPQRTGCDISSAVLGGDRLALIEHCDDDHGYRLTVLGVNQDDDEKVRQFGSTVITRGTADGPPPAVVAMSSSAIAVYDGGANPPEPDAAGVSDAAAPRRASVRQFNSDGVQQRTNTVNGPRALPEANASISGDGLTTFWTGRATVVLDASSMRPAFQVPGTLGPGQTMAGQLLLPIASGISVRDPATMKEIRTIRYARDGYNAERDGMIALRVLGNRVVEQWGSTVAVYGPPT
ncbi:hypothetical protein GII30_17270 [Gordonia amarae]|uniref:Uncharacterized protein n=1 Tax=Gordonia amarae TaxID=36821 RepID=A0A857MDU9_9ACTN|nr:hypothetical protein [Gordonia amarae]QHN18532.1 hypothetical protein GII35_17590 [Gordonia amarae]QHN23015.1 hypothetical protein GII34_17130 [Gordonia amarae]QHN31917.1 hypothetical protein GII32_17435 [Gordonia amarae]QHN40664.1 hypothetical protein GII30_17270 [Gordonia amarae]